MKVINYPKKECERARSSSSGARGTGGPQGPQDPPALPTGTPSPTSRRASPTAWTTRASRPSRSRRCSGTSCSWARGSPGSPRRTVRRPGGLRRRSGHRPRGRRARHHLRGDVGLRRQHRQARPGRTTPAAWKPGAAKGSTAFMASAPWAEHQQQALSSKLRKPPRSQPGRRAATPAPWSAAWLEISEPPAAELRKECARKGDDGHALEVAQPDGDSSNGRKKTPTPATWPRMASPAAGQRDGCRRQRHRRPRDYTDEDAAQDQALKLSRTWTWSARTTSGWVMKVVYSRKPPRRRPGRPPTLPRSPQPARGAVGRGWISLTSAWEKEAMRVAASPPPAHQAVACVGVVLPWTDQCHWPLVPCVGFS